MKLQKRSLLATTLAVLVAAGMGAAASPAVAETASAERQVGQRIAPAAADGLLGTQVRTSKSEDCYWVGGRAATPIHSGCWIDDDVDGTEFKWDSGGKGARLEGRTGYNPHMTWKVEFHPKGQLLWVYDTADDGDTIYVSGTGIAGVVRPSSGHGVDILRQHVNIKEGSKVKYYIWDDVYHGEGANLLGTVSGVA